MKTRKQKEEIVEKLQTGFKNAASAVFLHFRGVNVAQESEIRRELKSAKISYFVAKKTLIRRALENLGHAHKDVALDGEVAVAYGGEDSTLAARLIHEAGKRLENKIVILGGLFEGSLRNKVEMQEIATIPSAHVLRGMFVNVINSPIAGLAVALKAVADKRGA